MSLTDVMIRSLKPEDRPYKRADAGGLYLEVRPTGAKLWRFKYRHLGKDNRIALGVYPEVRLAEARQLRDDARRKLREGVDPLAERKRQKLIAQFNAGNTFGDIAKEYIDKSVAEGRADATTVKAIGRGLRRVGYDKDENGLFLPEYVNVFGVPLSIYEPAEGGDAPPPPKPSTQIDVVPDRASLELKWPNVLRIETVVKPELTVEWPKVEPLTLDPVATVISAEIAPALGGAADMSKVTAIDLSLLPEEFRLQRLTFVAARKAFAELKANFRGNEEYLVFQLIRLVETFLRSDKVDIPSLFHSDPVRRRILVALNIDLIVRHVLRFVTEQNVTALTPVFDEEHPIGSTGQMRAWYTTKPNMPTGKSHISHVVGDSAWEQYAANVLESRGDVIAYAKNDHLSFQIHYLWQGSRRRYIPDFIVRLANGKTLALEIKGTDSQQNKAKREALDEWVRAINSAGGFGQWSWDVAFDPAQVHDIVAKHSS